MHWRGWLRVVSVLVGATVPVWLIGVVEMRWYYSIALCALALLIVPILILPVLLDMALGIGDRLVKISR